MYSDTYEMPPAAVDVGGGRVLQVSCGNRHTCVILEDGTLHCFGYNGYGQLGYGHTNHIGDGPGEMPPATVVVSDGSAAVVLPQLVLRSVALQNGILRVTFTEAAPWPVDASAALQVLVSGLPCESMSVLSPYLLECTPPSTASEHSMDVHVSLSTIPIFPIGLYECLLNCTQPRS